MKQGNPDPVLEYVKQRLKELNKTLQDLHDDFSPWAGYREVKMFLDGNAKMHVKSVPFMAVALKLENAAPLVRIYMKSYLPTAWDLIESTWPVVRDDPNRRQR